MRDHIVAIVDGHGDLLQGSSAVIQSVVAAVGTAAIWIDSPKKLARETKA